MAYLLNNLKDIQTVYTPAIECLIDDFSPYLSEFNLSKKNILDSMRFRMKFSNEKGEEGFSSELPLKTILGGIKLNLISRNVDNLQYNFDYEYLLSNLDLDVFNTELDKRVSLEENKFIEIIDSNLAKMNTILFEKNLKQDVTDLLNSISNLKLLYSSSNEFDKIIINKYLSSYRNIYSSLETEYRPLINNKEIFKSTNRFKSIESNGIGSFDWIKAFRPNPPLVGNYSDFMIQHLTDQMEFSNFKKSKGLAVLGNSSKKSKVSNWKNVAEFIFNGEIIVNKIPKGYELYFNETKYDSPTALGYAIALVLNEKKDTIRPIITDSINDSGGGKNIFVKRNVKYLKAKLDKDSSKISAFFKTKIEVLVSNDN